jgi:hypothetical protein
MAMQPQAWMTAFLFDAWISHFIAALNKRGGVSPTNRHLLVLDGHNSHVMLDVVRKAATVGLDIVTLPSHTSHHLQSLDVAVFRPFKCAFQKLRDAWILRHKCRPAQKEDLCQWVCLGLRKALSEKNIKKGFAKTGIWPFNPSIVDGFMGPAEAFQPDAPVVQDSSSDEADEVQDDDPVMAEVVEDRVPASQEDVVQYFVRPEHGRAPLSPRTVQLDTSESSDDEGCLAARDVDREERHSRFRRLLELPRIGPTPKRARRTDEPLIDYSKSIILTREDYISMMEEKARKKELAKKEREDRKLEADRKRIERESMKAQKEAEKQQKLGEAAALKLFKAQWTTTAVRKAGQDLHNAFASRRPLHPRGYVPPFCGILPRCCKDNQRYRKARLWARKNAPHLLRLIPETSPPAWIHECNPLFVTAEEWGTPPPESSNRGSEELRGGSDPAMHVL